MLQNVLYCKQYRKYQKTSCNENIAKAITRLLSLQIQQKLSHDFPLLKTTAEIISRLFILKIQQKKNDKTSCTENTTHKITRFLQLKTHQNITYVLLKTKIIKLIVLNLALIVPHMIISDFLYQSYTRKYHWCTFAKRTTKCTTGLVINKQ